MTVHVYVNTGEEHLLPQVLAGGGAVFLTEPRFRDLYPQDATVCLVDDLNSGAGLLEAVAGQVSLSDVGGAIALSERAAPAAAMLRTLLGLPGSGFDVVTRCTSKWAMKKAFARHGIPHAAGWLVQDEEQLLQVVSRFGRPVVVKPAIGSGADKTFRADSPEELTGRADIRDVLRSLASPVTTSDKRYPLVVEEALDVADEFHIDGCVMDGVTEAAHVSRYVSPVLEGLGSLFGSYLLDQGGETANELRGLHDRIVRALGVAWGVTHLEVFRLRSGQLRAGEIALRPGGGGIAEMLRLSAGRDLWGEHISASLGDRPRERATRGAPGRQVAQVMLPLRPGRLHEVSTREDFEHVSGFLDARMVVAAGQEASGLFDSARVAGYVWLEFGSVAQLQERLGEVGGSFRLVVDGNGSEKAARE